MKGVRNIQEGLGDIGALRGKKALRMELDPEKGKTGMGQGHDRLVLLADGVDPEG
jgi:hypothetical protein